MQLALEDQVVDLRVAVLAPVTAAGTGVEQGATQAVGVGAADQQVGAVLETVMAGGRADLVLHGGLEGRFFRDGAGDEVDDTADVLRAVAHCAAAAHHIHGVHVAHAQRRQRQLRLAIGGERHRDAVHQHGRTRRQAWVEAADAKVQRQVVAAGAIVVGGVDPGDAVEHLAGGGGAIALELFAAYHVAGTGVLEHIVLLRFGQPVADHGGGAKLDCAAGGGVGNRLQAEGVVGFLSRLQAAVAQQRIEALAHVVLAVQALGVHALGQLRAERDQCTAFAAELVEGVFKRTGGDVVAAGFGMGGGHGQAEGGGEQQGMDEWAGAQRHGVGPERGVLPCLSREVGKMAQVNWIFLKRGAQRAPDDLKH
ncbi:hypothetical protein D3C81_883110 [compost metagenome]